jgi:hypothetical protein
MKKIIIKLKQYLSRFIPTKIYLKIIYKKNFDRSLNLKNPQTLNEKIQWKKLYDKNPLYTRLADKYAVRDYIKEKIGEKYLIPLLYVTDKPEEIPFDKLPLPYIIKPNHGSAYILPIKKGADINKTEIIKKCKRWLKTNIYYVVREWQYKDIPPKIIIEKLLLNKERKVPDDCRFYCFNGKVKLIQMDVGRFENHQRGLFDINWKPLPFTWCTMVNGKLKYKTKEDIPKPKNLKEMIKIAEKLSKDFDFVRVDLYSVDGEIYFGELTFTPASGLSPFIPEKYDLIYGKKLKLKGFRR